MSGDSQARGLSRLRQWLTPLAFAALIAAVAMPELTLPRNTFNYIVTFDITQSMDVEDVVQGGAPVSRLKFAQAAMREALGRLPCGSKVGWSVFTGQRVLLLMSPVEVCGNYDALLVSLDGIDGRMRWTNWSRIAEGGVYSAVRVAQQVGGGAAIAFVTDGQEAPPVSPARALLEGINAARVRGWLIGVGGDQPAAIPKSDAEGNRIGYWQADEVIQTPPVPGSAVVATMHEELSELRGEYLASVAGQTGLDYRRLLSATSFGDALLDPRFARREPVPTDLRWCPALLALLLLVARFTPDAVLAGLRGCRKRIRTIVSLVARSFNGRQTQVD
ncbi:MxaL protein [Paraburkholderia sp. MMS20-SJTN17]|uniref:MxaL protein n=1 Tax=Paraburkholderia translucens TaxID=2886945 RepID=A0ABS8KEB2_9BURK|nr:MxaL protein [Paraburkholderia sp. MMS20-SJTN17]MCC8403116.1 MxaL protein [Paraburkholderia sp. MMS20-SJTN17]